MKSTNEAKPGDPIKTILLSFQESKRIVDRCLLEMQEARANIIHSPDFSTARANIKTDALERKVTAIITAEQRFEKARAKMLSDLEEIINLCDSLDFDKKTVIWLRYIYGLTWEKLAKSMNLEKRTAHRIHGRALSDLRKKQTEQQPLEAKTIE